MKLFCITQIWNTMFVSMQNMELYFKLSKYYKFGKYILGKNEWSSWWMDHSFFQVYIDRKLKSQICNNFGNSSYQ